MPKEPASSRDAEIILGIDFGTSYSSAAALINGEIQWVLDRGDAMIPSVVHLPAKGTPEVGMTAHMRLATHPNTTVQSVKRLLGRRLEDREVRLLDAGVGYQIVPGPRRMAALKIGGQTYACEQVASSVLSYLRDLAEKRFGRRIRKVIIAVPADSEPSYVSALRRAARISHLELLQVIPEPIAGALSLGLHGAPCDRRVAVCDFGGGTFDATLIEQKGVQFTPFACHGDTLLGGDDFDEILAEEVANSVQRRCGFNMRNDVVRWHHLRMRCESAKRILSSEEEAYLRMPAAYVEQGQQRNIDLLLDRKWVEAKWQPLIERMRNVLARLLCSSRWAPSEVEEVILIGGTSLIPMVRRNIAEFFEREQVTSNDYANVAVAYGATLQTAGHLAISTQLPSLTVAS
ncbi:MAG: Hsp70 family protein [Myxococcales bacterium]|nr:Hsp70 family protein [Myxococcales bacterium]